MRACWRDDHGQHRHTVNKAQDLERLQQLDAAFASTSWQYRRSKWPEIIRTHRRWTLMLNPSLGKRYSTRPRVTSYLIVPLLILYCTRRLSCFAQPKAALSDPPASVRPFSANSQTTSSPGYHPPPADKQKLVLCKYFEQGRDQQ